MCDRNVKSEYILIKLCALVFEYICERTTKFHEKFKILFDSRVINLQIPMTKYLGFQYSIAYCSLEVTLS